MELLLTRVAEILDTPGTPLTPAGKKRDSATIGRLEIDGVFQCHTLEDVQRVAKVDGRTAIPAGTYTVTLEPSPRLSAGYQAKGLSPLLPRLHHVPGFDGVLIHIGNFASDSEGCILVGSWKEGDGNMVTGSRTAYEALHRKLSAAKDGIRITIRSDLPGL